MVENESDPLRQRVKCLILETHERERGTEVIAGTISALNSLGFEIQERGDNTLAMLNRYLKCF
jgi:hypothetical protein